MVEMRGRKGVKAGEKESFHRMELVAGKVAHCGRETFKTYLSIR